MNNFDNPDFLSAFDEKTPVALEAETSLIGSLLLDNGGLDRIGDMVRPEHFFSTINRRIFAEICTQIGAGKSCDVVSVGPALEGVASYGELNAMAQYVPSIANIRRYAEMVVQRSKSRALLQVSGFITELAQAHEQPIEARVDQAQAQLSKLVDHAAADDWESASEGMVPYLDVLNDRAAGKTNAMPTGLPALDDYLEGGVRPGELVIIGARPSMGKTALAMTIGLHMAADYAVGMLSMEMPKAELRDRTVALLGQVSMSSLKRPARPGAGLDWGRVTEAMESTRALNFYATDSGGLNINQVRSKARNLKRTRGLNVLVVDYIGLMSGLDAKQQRAYQLEEISRGLKTLAKELGIAVLCLAQVNRKVEERADHTPALSDLRDSGAIEQDADVVMFVHRPIQARPDMGDEWATYAKVNIAKNRNGRCGVCNLSYYGEQTRFATWHGDAPTTRTQYKGPAAP